MKSAFLRKLFTTIKENYKKLIRLSGFRSSEKVTEEYDPKTNKLLKRAVERQPEKTLWDWLQLLIIPIVLAIGGYYFTAQQNHLSYELNKRQHDTDLQIAQDQQREDTLKAYLDDMSKLILEDNLASTSASLDVRTLARIRTLTVLHRLDGVRKGHVLKFLNESNLIKKDNPIVLLYEADFTNIIYHDSLNDVSVNDADFSNANFERTYFLE